MLQAAPLPIPENMASPPGIVEWSSIKVRISAPAPQSSC
jgi:hypothetical protein